MADQSKQEQARQGDVEAIAELIQSHTPFRQTKVRCKSILTTLEIEIESGHVFTPQLCVNEVIHILDKLTPKDINRAVISLRERGTIKIAYVRYLVLSSKGFEEAKGQSGLLILISLFLASMFVFAYFLLQRPPQSMPTPSAETGIPGNIVSTEWYEGGTLHQSTMRQWKSATEANKLATVADMVTVVKPELLTPDQVRPYAEDLKTCVEKTGEESSGADAVEKEAESMIEQSTVAEIAALCVVLMGW